MFTFTKHLHEDGVCNGPKADNHMRQMTMNDVPMDADGEQRGRCAGNECPCAVYRLTGSPFNKPMASTGATLLISSWAEIGARTSAL